MLRYALRGTVQCRRSRYSIAGYSAVSQGAVQCCGVKGSVEGCGTVLRGTGQCRRVRYSVAVQCWWV